MNLTDYLAKIPSLVTNVFCIYKTVAKQINFHVKTWMVHLEAGNTNFSQVWVKTLSQNPNIASKNPKTIKSICLS